MVAVGFLSLLANVTSTPHYLPLEFAHVQGCHANLYYDGKRWQESQGCVEKLKAAKNALEATVSFGRDSGVEKSHVELKDYKCPELEKTIGAELLVDTEAAWIGRSVDCDGEYLTSAEHYDGMGQAVEGAFRRLGLAATQKVRRVHKPLAFSHGDGPGRRAWTKAGLSDSMAAEFMFRLSHSQICESVLLKVCPGLKRKELTRVNLRELGKSPKTYWSVKTQGLRSLSFDSDWETVCDGKYCDWQSMIRLYQTQYWYARALHPLPYPTGYDPAAMNVAVHVRLGDRIEWSDLSVPKNTLESSIQFINDAVIQRHDLFDSQKMPIAIHVFTETPHSPVYAGDGPHKLQNKLLSMVRFPEHARVEWHIDEDDFVAWHVFATADLALVQRSSTFGTTAEDFLPDEKSPIAFGGIPQMSVRCVRRCFEPLKSAESQKTNACLNRCVSLKA